MAGVSVALDGVDAFALERVGAAPASPEPTTKVRGHGVTAQQLAARNRRDAGGLTPTSLRDWLVGEGLAIEVDGLLSPTRRALELGGGLA